MTATALTTSSPTASRHSVRAVTVGLIVFIAAVAVVLLLAVIPRGTSTTGVASTRDSGYDTTVCRPTSVTHFC
jgi:hypothetical protein